MSVSIFLPTHARNEGGSLAKAISSVLSQSYTNFELIVLDDGSSDGSEGTIRNFVAQDARVSTIRFEKNVGLPALTSAEAYARTTGKYIAWQFDDCEWLPGHLETLVAAAEASPEAGLVYAKAELLYGNGNSALLGEPISFEDLSQGNNTIPNCAALVPREVHERLGWLDPHILLKRTCDWDMWTRIAAHYPLKFVDKTIGTEHGPSLSESLGNSVGVEADLMLRYCKTDRREALLPANVLSRSPFQPPPGLDLTESDREKLASLVFQHFVRIKRPIEALPEISIFAPRLEKAWRDSAAQGIPSEQLAILLSGSLWLVNRGLGSLNEQRNESNKYIQFQRGVLDERFNIIKAHEKTAGVLHKQLEESCKQLEDSHKQLEYSHKQLEYSHKQLEDSHKQLEDLHKQIDVLNEQLGDHRKQIASLNSQLQMTFGRRARRAAKKILSLGQKSPTPSVARAVPPQDRPWQNWDVGNISAGIDEYWEKSELEKENRAALVHGIKAAFGTKLPIFEVGCGSGMIGRELINEGVITPALYSGGDITKAMLEIGRKRLPECELIELDIFNLSGLDRRDNVVCLHVLQHLPHYREPLQQLVRFAKKQLYIATWFSESGIDELSMGQDSPGKQLFNVNRYGLEEFINTILNEGRPISHLSTQHLMLHTHAVHVVFD